MVKIYDYGYSESDRYARDQREIEAFRKQYHVPTSATGFFASQAAVSALAPQYPSVALLLGLFQRRTWPNFELPPDYGSIRFASSYIGFSLQLHLPAKVTDYMLLIDTKARSAAAQDEGAKIKAFLTVAKEKNDLFDHIMARILQFIHG